MAGGELTQVKKPVGFNRKVTLRQLERTLEEARCGTNLSKIYQILDEALAKEVRRDNSRKKVITILVKIWYRIPKNLVPLRQRAIELASLIDPAERVLLHWGMAMLAFPFFRDVAHEMGTLLALQGEAGSGQIGRKIKGLYGERRHVEVAITAVLSSMKAWGIVEAGTDHVYRLRESLAVERPELKAWIIEVLLRAYEQQWMAMELIPTTPSLFPFRFSLHVHELEQPRLQLVRQGGNMTMVGVMSGS